MGEIHRSGRYCRVKEHPLSTAQITIVKIFVDFMPLLVFFIAFKLQGIFVACAATMLATVVQFLYLRHINAKISKLQIFGLALILLLGAGTLLFHDQRFLFWKATIADGVFAGAMLVSLLVGSKPATQMIYEESFGEEAAQVPSVTWRRLTWQWVAFFLLEGVLNLVVAFHCPLNTWVYFKAFGMPLMTMMMMLLQACQLKPLFDAAAAPAASPLPGL